MTFMTNIISVFPILIILRSINSQLFWHASLKTILGKSQFSINIVKNYLVSVFVEITFYS